MLVALPSSIAFGVLVFGPLGPEFRGAGALAGVIGAAALGIVAPLVSRNGGFITAPCAPAAAVMSGLAFGLMARHLTPAEAIGLMGLTALLSSILQITYGSLGAGRLIKYIPFQVVSGYLSGVAVIIAIGQIPKFLGLPGDVGFFDGLTSPTTWRWEGVVVGVVTIVVMVAAPRFTRRVPGAILGLAAGVAVYFLLGFGSRGLWQLSGNSLVVGTFDAGGSILEAASTRLSSVGTIRLSDLTIILMPALTLSLLLSIDTLKTGVVLDALTRGRHNSNRELVAQGAANAVSFVAGGMPGAGTMGPTLVNVTSGGRSPRSGVFEGVLVVLTFLVLGSFIAWVPIGALAGILLVIAWRMFDWRMFQLLRHKGTRLDFVVIASVIIVAESVGLIEASVVGVCLAIFLFIRDQTLSSVVIAKNDLSEIRSKRKRTEVERGLLREHGSLGGIVQLQGNLFFGTTDQLYTELEADLKSWRWLALDFRRVQSMDFTAGHLIEQMHDRLRGNDGGLLFCGMPSVAPTRQDIERYLDELGLVRTDEGIRVFETRDSALEWMEDQVLGLHGWSAPESAPPLDLTELEIFAGLEEETVGALRTIVEERTVPVGSLIFSRGEVSDELFVMRKGRIHITLPLNGGKKHHLATFSRGDCFGELAFLDRQPRSADADAATETELYVLSRAAFETLAKESPGLASTLFERLARSVSLRLRGANVELRALETR